MQKIDDCIPIPTHESWEKKLDRLEVNQSIKVLKGSEESVRQVSWRKFHSKGTKRFRTMIDPTDTDNFRTWRVE